MEAKNRLVRWEEKSENRSAQERRGRVLRLVLVIMALVCIAIVVSAFFAILECNKKIAEISSDLSQCLKNKGLCDEIERIGKYLIERLETVGMRSMESNTVSFLVTVLSAIVVALGLYLVDRIRREMRDLEVKVEAAREKTNETEKRAQQVRTSFDNLVAEGVTIWRISSWLSRAEQISLQFQRTEDEGTLLGLVPYLRDLLTFVRVDLEETKTDKMTISEELRRGFLDQVMNVKLNLEGVHPQFQEKVRELIDRCDRIIKLLKDLGSRKKA